MLRFQGQLPKSWVIPEKKIPITLKKPPSLNALWHSFLLKVTLFLIGIGAWICQSQERDVFFATGMCRHAQVMGSVSASREEGLLPQVLGPSAPSAIFSFAGLLLFSHLSVSTSIRYESLFFIFPSPGIPVCFPSLLLCLHFPSQCFLPEFPFCCCLNLSLTHITLSFSVFTTVWYFPELLWLSWGSSYHCIIQFLPCWKKKKYATCFSTVSVHEGDNSVKKCQRATGSPISIKKQNPLLVASTCQYCLIWRESLHTLWAGKHTFHAEPCRSVRKRIR